MFGASETDPISHVDIEDILIIWSNTMCLVIEWSLIVSEKKEINYSKGSFIIGFGREVTKFVIFLALTGSNFALMSGILIIMSPLKTNMARSWILYNSQTTFLSFNISWYQLRCTFRSEMYGILKRPRHPIVHSLLFLDWQWK